MVGALTHCFDEQTEQKKNSINPQGTQTNGGGVVVWEDPYLLTVYFST